MIKIELVDEFYQQYAGNNPQTMLALQQFLTNIYSHRHNDQNALISQISGMSPSGKTSLFNMFDDYFNTSIRISYGELPKINHIKTIQNNLKNYAKHSQNFLIWISDYNEFNPNYVYELHQLFTHTNAIRKAFQKNTNQTRQPIQYVLDGTNHKTNWKSPEFDYQFYQIPNVKKSKRFDEINYFFHNSQLCEDIVHCKII